MIMVSDKELIKKARSVAGLHTAPHGVRIGDVGCALATENGKIHTGVSIHASCGVGFCAEHSAIASMVTGKEYVIRKIVSVSDEGEIFPPCGRCRELMYQVDEKNDEAEVIVGENESKRLKELLPLRWQRA